MTEKDLIEGLIVKTGDITREKIPAMQSAFLLLRFSLSSELAGAAMEHLEKMAEEGKEIEKILMKLDAMIKERG